VRKIVKIILLTLILITGMLLALKWFATAIFSEYRPYGRVSLDYYLLTPKELAQLSKHCENAPEFVYSQADGPKPLMVTLNCVIFEEKVISNYANKNNFDRVSATHFKKGSIEIGFVKNDADKITSIIFYEYFSSTKISR